MFLLGSLLVLPLRYAEGPGRGSPNGDVTVHLGRLATQANPIFAEDDMFAGTEAHEAGLLGLGAGSFGFFCAIYCFVSSAPFLVLLLLRHFSFCFFSAV